MLVNRLLSFCANRRRLLADERGFTMVLVLGVTVVASLLLAATYVAANGDIHLTGTNTAQKKAYYAAQAGITDYLYHLTEDGAYLGYCTKPPQANPALNQFYKEGTTKEKPENELKASELTRAKVNGAENEEYAIQLLPAKTGPETDPKCDPSKLAETMVEKSGHLAGTFRILSTGFSGNERRSIVATFKNEGFPSFVYYTVYETTDPAAYEKASTKEKEECEHYYPERVEKKYTWCSNIYFTTYDNVKGPLHSEDHGGICGSPTFGRNENDKIEFGHHGAKGETEETKGYSAEGSSSCGTPSPKFTGTYVPPEKVVSIQPPPSDTELELLAESNYTFEGKTEIVLEGNEMTVTNAALAGSPKKMTYPSNGVIYVKSSAACTENYDPYGVSYPGPTECGNIFVHGSYESSLTIGAENDIIINGNITTPNVSGVPTSASELGLIANKFVRIYHPVELVSSTKPTKKEECVSFGFFGTCKEYKTKYTCPSGLTFVESTMSCNAEASESECTAKNATGTMKNVEIYAAILAINHSFIVDNYNCKEGEPLEKLTVHGAIAQKFRGPVGTFFTSTGKAATGYEKVYEYDERLRASEPPYFLNPVQAPWKILRETLGNPPPH